MTQSIHGHEVLHFMLDAGTAFTRAGLMDAIQDRFGADARFHTCSADSMDAAARVVFLEVYGKFVPAGEGGFNTAVERICSHE